MAFRDDREALLARIAALESELAQAAGPARKEALEQLHALAKQVADATAELDQQRDVLGELGSRLDEVRATLGGRAPEAPRPKRPVVMLAIGSAILLATGVALYLARAPVETEGDPVPAPPPPAPPSVPEPPERPLAKCPEVIGPAIGEARGEITVDNPFGAVGPAGSCLEGRAVAIPGSVTKLADVRFDAAPLTTFASCSLAVTHQPALGPPGAAERSTGFGVRWRGRFRTARSGEHRFALTSDDGSRLIVDGTAVVDNDGLHSRDTREGVIDLPAGDHAIEIAYFQGPDHVGLELDVSPPGCGPSPFALGTTIACPPGAFARPGRCTYEGFTPPAHAGEYCGYLADGYFGYGWPLAGPDRDHVCPRGMERADNPVDGPAYCVVREVVVPAGFRAVAECETLREGKIGYRVERAP